MVKSKRTGNQYHPLSDTCRACGSSEWRFRKDNQFRYCNICAKRRATGYKRKYRFGVTPEQYEQMKLDQGAKCLLCGTPENEKKRALAVDHDHVTGVVRGLLCSECNVALGLLKDDPDLIQRAAEYLRRHGGGG